MNRAIAESIEIDLVAIDDATSFVDNESTSPKKINFEFDQRNETHGIYRKITVSDGTHCNLTIKNKHQREHKYRIDIACLEAKPYRRRKIAWGWLYAFLGFTGLLVILYFGNWWNSGSITMLGTALGLSLLAIATLARFFYQSSDRIYFRSQFGRIKLIEMINNNPNKALFREFIHNLVMQINTAKAAKRHDTSQFLAHELRELRRLNEEKVLPTVIYNHAKQRILQHPGFSGQVHRS